MWELRERGRKRQGNSTGASYGLGRAASWLAKANLGRGRGSACGVGVEEMGHIYTESTFEWGGRNGEKVGGNRFHRI
ncbi:hypothetical protein E2562_017876 [Oryza meyeriana var. granulata]|uniref:Uncharacterized protein n=1 Tax=Oryza meyeriana var. granulata TaxID=110450 RepID=A0A6G1DYX4_9ORYZ|nr:hypothetical protein E2562_017876 [Oryza meyeriana var. granulata]